MFKTLNPEEQQEAKQEQVTMKKELCGEQVLFVGQQVSSLESMKPQRADGPKMDGSKRL